jgi:adenylosuccinate synthase
MKSLNIITDMQYGSTGKGLFAGFLAEDQQIDTVVTAWGPNAGHTYIDQNGRRFVHTMLANGIVGSRVRYVLIGPGSVIDVPALEAEIDAAQDIIAANRISIFIHSAAAVVDEWHRQVERQYGFRIGSTMKGTAEAMIQKLRRMPDNQNTAGVRLRGHTRFRILNPDEWTDFMESDAKHVMIEGAQGYSLSINHGFYPYTTSRDCTTAQLLVDCGIPFKCIRSAMPMVWGVCRSYPIRVANRFDADGNQIGTSGPCYEDQKEIDWEQIGVEPELTTVTKLVRRVFTLSDTQLREAVRVNGINAIFLNFANYVPADSVPSLVGRIERVTGWCPVLYTGWGPRVTDIHRWGSRVTDIHRWER